MHKLDKKDRAILYQLDLDSRQNFNSIGKKVRLSREVVQYRVKQLGIETQFFMAESFKDDNVFEIVGNAAEGVLMMTLKQGKDDYFKTFSLQHQTSFGEEPGIYSDFAYDAANILFAALKKSDGSAKSIRDNIAVTNFRGATGPTVFDKKGDTNKEYEVFVVKNQKFVPWSS